MNQLNETYESFVELRQLAQEIEDSKDKIKNYEIYPLSFFAKRNYNILKDFLNYPIGLFKFRATKQFSKIGGACTRPSEYNILVKLFHIDKQVVNNFKHVIIIKNNMYKTYVILHELQHAYDEFISNNKSLFTKSGAKYINNLNAKKTEKISKLFFRSAHEKSAFFVETLHKISFYADTTNTLLRPFYDVYEDFKNAYMGYRHLTDKDKNILSRKFAQYYQKMKENQNKPIKEMKIVKLDEYLEQHIDEDFYNPFDEKTSDTNPKLMSDKGGMLKLRKETFNINRVEYSKRANGQYTVISKNMISKGEIVEICPVIPCGIEAKAIDNIKDLIFEIDRMNQQYGLVLGYGSLYQHSENPNLSFGYNKSNKQMYFTAIRMIKAGEELTINYGKEYWDERKNFNTMAPLPQPEPENESMGLQEPVSTMSDDLRTKQFGAPNNPANPAISGRAILAGGQS
jgi:hypothetical protein